MRISFIQVKSRVLTWGLWGRGQPGLTLTLAFSLDSFWGCSSPYPCAGTSIPKTTARSPSTEAAAVPTSLPVPQPQGS